MTQTLASPAPPPPAPAVRSRATTATAPRQGGVELRKFVAPTMSECLNRVKSELGPSAVILATRSVQERRFLGLMKREHVEITAGRGLRRPQPTPQPTPQRRPVSQSPATPSAPGKELLGTSAAASAAYLGVTQEVGELKKLVTELTIQFQNSKTPDLPDALAAVYRRLISQQVSEPTAKKLVEAVRDNLTPEQLKDAAAVRKAALEAVAGRLPICGESKKTTNGRPHVIALVGPTGVGKTTTIAKLAANLKLRKGAKVALITIDTYRIAAVDQLRRYAEIIDAPLAVVNAPNEIADAVARVGDHDYVLIDTAGRSPRDAVKLKELQQFLAAANPAETHLVLSTTCGRSSMMLALQRFSGVKTDKLIFTKLDEADDVGATLDVVAEKRLPVSYVTAGQDVPDDIEVADPRRLAKLILGDA